MSKAKDLSVKKCISLPSVFCDLYSGGTFKGKQLLKPEDLQQLPDESCEVFYDKNQKREIQRYHNIIYGSAIVQKEHRKIRGLKGNGQFLSGILKEDRLKPVVPLIFYYGEEPWDGAMDLHSILPDRKVRP